MQSLFNFLFEENLLDKANKNKTIDITQAVPDALEALGKDGLTTEVKGNNIFINYRGKRFNLPSDIVKMFEGSEYWLCTEESSIDLEPGEYHNLKYRGSSYNGLNVNSGDIKFMNCTFSSCQRGGLPVYNEYKVEFDACTFQCTVKCNSKVGEVYFKDCVFELSDSDLVFGSARPGFLPTNIKKIIDKLVKKPDQKVEDIVKMIGVSKIEGNIKIKTMKYALQYLNRSLLDTDPLHKIQLIQFGKKFGRTTSNVIAEWDYNWSK